MCGYHTLPISYSRYSRCQMRRNVKKSHKRLQQGSSQGPGSQKEKAGENQSKEESTPGGSGHANSGGRRTDDKQHGRGGGRQRQSFRIIMPVFEQLVKRLQRIPTSKQLAVSVSRHHPDIPLEDIQTFLVQHPVLARFEKNVKRPSDYQSIQYPRPGTYHLDYADFHRSWASENNGASGFLVAVENFSNRLFVIPCGDKSTISWLRAIDQFVELSRNVNSIYSDREIQWLNLQLFANI